MESMVDRRSHGSGSRRAAVKERFSAPPTVSPLPTVQSIGRNPILDPFPGKISHGPGLRSFARKAQRAVPASASSVTGNETASSAGASTYCMDREAANLLNAEVFKNGFRKRNRVVRVFLQQLA